MEVGTGKEAASGDFCEVSYQLFTQNGLYLDSVGYGQVRPFPSSSHWGLPFQTLNIILSALEAPGLCRSRSHCICEPESFVLLKAWRRIPISRIPCCHCRPEACQIRGYIKWFVDNARCLVPQTQASSLQQSTMFAQKHFRHCIVRQSAMSIACLNSVQLAYMSSGWRQLVCHAGKQKGSW